MFIPSVETGWITGNVAAINCGHVNFFICKDGDNLIAIDAGMGEVIICRELKKLSIDPNKVALVFLTHTDRDHTGGLGLFQNAQVFMSKEEEQMTDGSTPRILKSYNKLPGRNYKTLIDGDIIVSGKIKVKAISTPGHTKGSMSYLVNDNVLFSGDTVALGAASFFFRLLNMDNKLLITSLKKIAALKGLSLLCTAHTGVKDFDEAMKKWRSLRK